MNSREGKGSSVILGPFSFLVRQIMKGEIMVGTLICTDTSKLEDFGFVCHTRHNGSRFYSWVSNGIHDGHIDICVHEYSDHKTGWFEFHKLNKLTILPKIVQLANAGILKNYEL